MANFKDIMDAVANGKEIGKGKLAEAAEAAVAKVDSATAANKRLRDQAMEAGAQLGEEATTAGVFGTLEFARGYRGDKGLKVWDKDPTMVVGLVTQGVGLFGKIRGKKWGRWVNGIGRGFTLSGFGAIARNAGKTMAETMAKKETKDAANPAAPNVQGRREPRQLPHPQPGQPEVIVSPRAEPQRERLERLRPAQR